MTKSVRRNPARLPLYAAGAVWLAWQWPGFAHAAGGGGAGGNFIWIALFLLSAHVAARLVERVRAPGVLGELLVGIVLGNLAHLGITALDEIKADAVIAFLAELGVVILLFQIGLESSLGEMRKVGARALAVAFAGVVAPFVLGTYVVGPWLMPGQSASAYLFLGATLTATSVGITGRVFRDLGRLGTPEAQIVLGAAVIDDVLGLVILAVVTSIVQQGSIGVGQVMLLIVEALGFLAGSILLGRAVAPALSRWIARVHGCVAMKLALILGVCLVMAWLAHLIGLAPIVGAFAAGLVLEPVFLTDFDEPEIVREIRPVVDRDDSPGGERIREVLARYSGHHHHHLLEPLGYFFVPIFFVYTGMQVDLASLGDPKVVGIALAVTLAAFAGKIVAGFFAGSADRWVVGWGMAPRGEVGLIFAMVGKQLGVVSDELFAVVVLVVVLTTLITPFVLMRLLSRHDSG